MSCRLHVLTIFCLVVAICYANGCICGFFRGFSLENVGRIYRLIGRPSRSLTLWRRIMVLEDRRIYVPVYLLSEAQRKSHFSSYLTPTPCFFHKCLFSIQFATLNKSTYPNTTGQFLPLPLSSDALDDRMPETWSLNLYA